LKQTLGAYDKELREKDKLIEKYEMEIRQRHDKIEKKQIYIARLNKKFEALASNKQGSPSLLIYSIDT
jgi:predicted RNase H-like nuclease (RuvC/YqgF family)